MKFQQVMAFFLTGATALSISTTALAADLPDNVDTTVSATQTADEQENNLYTRNDKDLTDAEFEQKYELPENSWFTPAVRYVIENNIMLPAGHIDGKEYFPWFNPAENRPFLKRNWLLKTRKYRIQRFIFLLKIRLAKLSGQALSAFRRKTELNMKQMRHPCCQTTIPTSIP